MIYRRFLSKLLLAIAAFITVIFLGTTTVQAQFSAAPFDISLSPETSVPDRLEQSRSPSSASDRGVIGPDNRLRMTRRDYPWSAIGRVDFATEEGQAHCSGTLVEADVVLTNAHCVIDPATHEFHENIQFAPNVIDGQILSQDDVANAESIFPGTDFRDRPQPPHPDDWAFIKLDRPLGDRYGTVAWQPLPLAALLDGPEQYVLVGYSGDFPEENPGMTAGVHDGCSIIGSADDAFLRHNCDTFSGSSGGPILRFFDDQPVIVALNSAALTDRATNAGIVNFAVDLTRMATRIEQLSSR